MGSSSTGEASDGLQGHKPDPLQFWTEDERISLARCIPALSSRQCESHFGIQGSTNFDRVGDYMEREHDARESRRKVLIERLRAKQCKTRLLHISRPAGDLNSATIRELQGKLFDYHNLIIWILDIIGAAPTAPEISDQSHNPMKLSETLKYLRNEETRQWMSEWHEEDELILEAMAARGAGVQQWQTATGVTMHACVCNYGLYLAHQLDERELETPSARATPTPAREEYVYFGSLRSQMLGATARPEGAGIDEVRCTLVHEYVVTRQRLDESARRVDVSTPPTPVSDVDRFPTPEGTVWSAVTIQIVGPEKFRVQIGDIVRDFECARSAFRDKRNGKPKQSWHILCELAREKGRLRTTQGRGQRRSAHDQVGGLSARPSEVWTYRATSFARLAEDLRTLMGLTDCPFDWKAGIWIAKFQIRDRS